MLNDELSDLAIFAAVADARSFTRAAARLGKSQSALSQSVRRLEERLKLRLLTRTTRSVMPTPAGEQLLTTLRPALGEIEAQLNALSELRELPSGSLRLTAGRHAAETVLWPALLRLNTRYPDIKVEVSIEPALTDIVTEQYDAGVRLGEQIARDMIALRIGPDLRMVVVGCPAYLAEHGIPVEPQDLTHHRCCNIRLPTSGGLYVWEFERDGPLEAVLAESIAGGKLVDVGSVFEMTEHYRPTEPHWYFSLIGVEVLHWNEGCGATLLQHGLRQCDREHRPAYLWSSNPQNTSLYRRHGRSEERRVG